jgi:predicted flap endonuclease-1-like 5' DNA nuclease
VKKFVRIALLVAAWAAVTWLYRDKLLPLPRPDKGPVPHFRTGTAERQAPASPVAGPAARDRTDPTPATLESPPRSEDDLTEILGIGPVYRSRLVGAGIATFADLAAADPLDVAAAIDVADTMVAGWIAQAQEMGH